MHFLLRLAIVLGAIVIFSDIQTSALAQEMEQIFARAIQLEKEGKKQEVLNAYETIFRNNRNNPEIAAEALFRGGLFAAYRFGTTEDEKKHGKRMAVQHWWHQLLHDYPNTKAAAQLTQPTPEMPRGQLAAVENELDRLNSKDWKYKLIDFLVKLTGKNPHYSYALALILLAIFVKLLLLPLTKKQYAAMREMQRMQPLVKQLQEKYKGAELQQKMMELYKEHGVNPFASCLPTLFMMPFLILVFQAIQEYEFAFSHGHFLWIGSSLAEQYKFIAPNLRRPDVPLLIIYVLTNYITMRMTPATDPQQQQQQNTMAILMSGLFFYMFLAQGWSSAFTLYWLALNLISIWQQYEYVIKPAKARLQESKTQATGPESLPAVDVSRNGAGTAGQESKTVSPAQPPVRVRPRKKNKKGR